MNPDQVREAVQGVDSILHCAVGNAAVTVEGTRNLLAAALAAGVRRVVHFSTVDVYGRAGGVVDEEQALLETGREYGDSKIEAEKVCLEFVEKGLEVTILRPTIVYGPFSDLWTVEPALRLGMRNWLLPVEACQGTCNLVYVDDLVRASVLALDAPGVVGRAYNVNGPDRPTWHQYVEALRVRLSLPEQPQTTMGRGKITTTLVDPARNLIKFVFFTFEPAVMKVYQSSRMARTLMKGVQSTLRKVPSGAEYDLYGRVVDFPTDRARADLGFEPAVDMENGIDLSAAWIEHTDMLRSLH